MTLENNMKSMTARHLPLFLTIGFVFLFLGSQAQSRKAEAADLDFDNLRYALAIPKYKKAYSRVKGNKMEKNRITFQLAECYRLTNEPKRPMLWTEKFCFNSSAL